VLGIVPEAWYTAVIETAPVYPAAKRDAPIEAGAILVTVYNP
jgi:hypothetical protein